MKTKRLFLVAFVVSGLAFVRVQRSDAQTFVGSPGIETGPGVNYGYPHFEYGISPYGLYYRQPNSGYYGGPSGHGHRVYYHHHRHHLQKTSVSVGPITD